MASRRSNTPGGRPRGGGSDRKGGDGGREGRVEGELEGRV